MNAGIASGGRAVRRVIDGEARAYRDGVRMRLRSTKQARLMHQQDF
jgi:hypothetical protein